MRFPGNDVMIYLLLKSGHLSIDILEILLNNRRSLNMFCFHLASFLLALKWRMARHRAVPLQIRCHPQDLVWSCIPTRQAMASAVNPSCTALTVTTTCHQSPSPEILPFLESCKLKISSGDFGVSILVVEAVLSRFTCWISGMERT